MPSIANNWCTQAWCQYDWVVPTGYQIVNTQIQIVTPGTLTQHLQVNIVAYNITQFRVLWQISSDGIVSNNFTSSSDQSADKAVINLKNDIIEKYWQTTGVSAEWFQFDAGSGKTINMDTFALIGHNLTNSAVVTIYGQGASTDPTPSGGSWATTPIYAGPLTMPDDPNETNLIWVAPTSPLVSYRYWRVTIADPTNPAGFIRIGRAVAGQALVFNGENCLEGVELTQQSFKDKMQLNGFSTISNNRAVKKLLEIHFRNLDRISQTNYRGLKKYFNYCRDTLKALVIMDPSTENSKYVFTTFAKLQTMPKESHTFVSTDASYTMLDLILDEAQ